MIRLRTFRGGFTGLVLVSALLYPAAGADNRAATPADSVALSPLHDLGPNLYKSFIGWNSLLHLAGVGATYGIVQTGVDSRVQHYFNQRASLSAVFNPAAITGMLVPVFGSGGVYLYGKFHPNREGYGAGCALIQANVISFTCNSLLKAFTGRPYPDYYRNNNMDSLSRVFRYGFMRGGIFWGWPSGHTSATMTTAACLANYYPGNRWVKIGGFALTAYTIVGVAAVKRGEMH
jgi:membrane-associated phospholipid phosphatase